MFLFLFAFWTLQQKKVTLYDVYSIFIVLLAIETTILKPIIVMKHFFASVLLIALTLSAYAQQENKMMRFPSIHGETVVFSFAGDLYRASINDGIAHKLTNSNGYEMFAKISPNGKNIAFTGQMDGNTEVFMMPIEGGQPKRLTYTATSGRDDVSDRMGPNNIVMTWQDDSHIVFRSRKQTFNSFKGSLFVVDTLGNKEEQLPLSYGGFCSFSPNKKQLAYNQVFREFRTWKYYQGGMADDIWIYDFETEKTENISQNVHQDIFPMWHKDKVFYISDKDRIMNLFCYDTKSKNTTKVTDFQDYDIKFPSIGKQAIVFEHGGELWRYNIDEQQSYKIPIYISTDFPETRTQLKKADKMINTWSVSPDGKRVAFGARGDIFTVPAKEGITRNLSHSSGIHERNVEWSPKGDYISFIADTDGNDEIYIIKQDGSEPAKQLTSDGETYKFNPIWSPDGKYLLWGDKKLRLQLMEVESQKTRTIAQGESWEIRDYNWSPDNQWICYTLPQEGAVSKIMAYNLNTQKTHAITDDWYNASGGSFSSDGKYLFFVSSRSFNPIYSRTEWNHAYQDMDKIYFVALQATTPSPFAPKNDEVKTENNKTEDKAEGKKEQIAVKIDFEGIHNRVIALPLGSSNYFNVHALEDVVYFTEWNRKAGKLQMHHFTLNKAKDQVIGDIGNFNITADKKHMLLNQQGKFAIIPLPSSPIKIEEYISTQNMEAMVNPKAEWQQIYREAWRQMRDFFYDENMHGVNWEAMKLKYDSLVPYVENRYDLNYLIGELIGELNVGHAYINGGELIKPKRIPMGLLGAQISQDPQNGFFKIDSLLRSQNWDKAMRAPLTEAGMNVHKGDYIVAINGIATNTVNNIYQLLINKANKEVVLSINPSASTQGARDIVVKPIADESKLYYYTWVQQNIEKVNKATNGKVGYIHIPDMGPDGLNEFVKHFFPQLNKQALIIDDRGNGGGNVSPMLIERLNRELTMYTSARNTNIGTKPAQMMNGPKVLLLNKYSASDGDLFPYQFKKMTMGTTIGERSWGGVVGIRGSLPFIDGADLRKPEFAPFDTEGKKWIIEGYGVDPDIVVHNDPHKEYQGIDQQLNKAIEVILKQLQNSPQKPDMPIKPNKAE